MPRLRFGRTAAALLCGTALASTGWYVRQSAARDGAAPRRSAPPATGMSTRGPTAGYDDEGRLIRPQDHREWVFIGAPVTPNDMNDGHAAFPEFHNVYIDPAAYAAYRRTGRFADGTVILKELVSVGGKSMASGNGYFQGDFVSLEAMVKDRGRYPQEPGGWAFFRFGEAPDYESVGTRMKTADCNTCHATAAEDYVFTDTYPVLRAARPRQTGRK